MSQRIAQWGAQSSIWIALGGLVLIFALWIFYRYAMAGGRTRGVPIGSFLFVFISALLLADYSREVDLPDVKAYGKARTYWILHSKKSSYPQWPTAELKRALQSQVPSEIDSAIDSVVKPEFEKIPAYSGVYEGCLPMYRELALKSGVPPSGGRGADHPPYFFACRLIEGVLDRIGRVPASSPTQCLYGPAVKIIHALDRQGLRCPLTSVRGQPMRESVCNDFKAQFGTDTFSFCT